MKTFCLDAVSEMDNSSLSRIVELLVSDDEVQFYWFLTGDMDEDAGTNRSFYLAVLKCNYC